VRRVYTAQEVRDVTAEHYFLVTPDAYREEGCACGWACPGWDARLFEAHLASRLAALPLRRDGGQCPTCAHPEGYDRLSGPCPTCHGVGCNHEWLDRPESDTRECLFCGDEVAG
jgi:hypothetical protein